MSLDNLHNENENNLTEVEERRRQKIASFQLKIADEADILKEPQEIEEDKDLSSYSGEEVREQIERNSKQALRKLNREEKRERKARSRHNRRIFRFMWIITVVIIGCTAGLFINTGINDMLAINRKGEDTVVIEIPENPDLDSVTNLLVKNEIINEPTYFKLFAKLTKSKDFHQGKFEIKKNMDYEALVNYLCSNSNRTDVVSVTITEGENVLEIAETLKENGALGDKDAFLELCKSDKFDEDFDFLASITNTSDRYYKLEGYLYPDTYQFYANDDPVSIIYKFLNNYETKINEKREVSGYDKKTKIVNIVKDSDYSLDEIMIIASIIQAEAADVDDMYYISSILHNRLDADSSEGVSNLGLDSTKYYPYRTADDVPDGIGNGYVSNYDTYDSEGLPAGAICNPGMDAIIAALNPNSTNYLFFCHDSDGNPYYASTIWGHQYNLEYYVND